MNDKAVSLLRKVIARPGMFLSPDDLSYAVAFISGVNCALHDESPEGGALSGFHDWIVDRYFDKPQAFAWEVLIAEIPECAQLSESERVSFFLNIVSDFLDETAEER